MMMIMPVFILVIFNQFAAGLSLYYLTYNVLSAIQQKFINKSIEEEAAVVKDQPKTKGSKGSKAPRAKSSKNGQDKSSRKKKSGSKG